MLLAKTSLLRAGAKSAPPPITTGLITSTGTDVYLPNGEYTAIEVEWISGGGPAYGYYGPWGDPPQQTVFAQGGFGGGWGKSVPITLPTGTQKLRVYLGQPAQLEAFDAANNSLGYVAQMGYTGWQQGSGQFNRGGDGPFVQYYGYGYGAYAGGGGAANSGGPGGAGVGGGSGYGGSPGPGTMPAGRGGDPGGTQASNYGAGAGAYHYGSNGGPTNGCAYITWL